jgi:hypothetical protein
MFNLKVQVKDILAELIQQKPRFRNSK